jgi:SAM-dependent methyltransferase
MHFIDKLHIKYYHQKRAKVLGAHPARVQGWRSLDAQENRFEALCQPFDLTGKSVLDLGCGYGDLKHYFDSPLSKNDSQNGTTNGTTNDTINNSQINSQQFNSKHNIASYIGIDQHRAFIKSARLHFSKTANTAFIKADFSNIRLPKADIVMASGSLNYYSREKDYLQKRIIAMYESASEAVAFNLLDSRIVSSGKLLIAYDPQEILSFCRSICMQSQLFDDYANNDFTIVMRR